MRSIPLAMTWEMLHRGRWSLLTGILGANLLPVFLFSALRSAGALPNDDPAFLIMHLGLVQIGAYVFGAAVFGAQGSPSRLYTYPISNAAIAAWHLFPAMAVVALQSVASTAVLNAWFHLGWPLWGPALLLAVMMAAILAVLWLLEKSIWMPVAIAAVGAILGIWFKSRYGPPFSQPTHFWREVTLADMAFLLAAGAAAYAIGVAAVARNRRGEPAPSLGILAWLDGLVEAAVSSPDRFRSAEEAQFWFEWRQKGWFMPAAVLFGMVLGCGGWAAFNRDWQELLAGFVAGGGLLSAAGLIGGLSLGVAGATGTKTEMGPFLGTRPMTTPDLARIVLKVAARSVLIAWGLWATPFLAFYLGLRAAGMPTRFPIEHGVVWYFPATLLGIWIVAMSSAAVMLIGREGLLVKLLCGLFVAYIGGGLLSKIYLSPQARMQVENAVVLLTALVLVAITVGAFWAARRRKLIGAPTVYGAAGVWAALAAAVVLALMSHPARPLSLYVFLFGLAALVVAPFASTPLALAWNRNR